MQNRLMVLDAPVTSDQTLLAWPGVLVPREVEVMFVSIKTGAFERCTVKPDGKGALFLTRPAPVDWAVGDVLVPWNPEIEINPARTLALLRKEVFRNVRV